MPTEATALQAVDATHPDAARRILRLALGASLALCVSQLAAWQVSYMAPVLTLLILSQPVPAPRLKGGIAFLLALGLPMLAGLMLVPFLLHARWAGILLVGLAMYYTFFFTARGGPAVLGTFMTVGLTLAVTVGSTSGEFLLVVIQAVLANAAAALVFVWIAHALLPDRERPAGQAPPPPPERTQPAPGEVRRNAMRALLVVFPVALLFMFMSASWSYAVIMLKVATMGQQATSDRSRAMGRSLLESTVWGCGAALAAWYLLQAWPNLLLYVALTGLAGLLFGRRIFRGPAAAPDSAKWFYAYLTMLILLGPAVLDTASGGGGAQLWLRLGLFLVIAVYGTAAVAVFDAFWPPAAANAEPGANYAARQP